MIKIENTIKDKVSQINSSNNVNQYLNIKLEQENNKDSKTTITKSKNQDIYKTIRKKASIINSDQRNIQDKISLIQAQEQKISQIENTLKYARKEYEQAIKSEKKEEVKQNDYYGLPEGFVTSIKNKDQLKEGQDFYQVNFINKESNYDVEEVLKAKRVVENYEVFEGYKYTSLCKDDYFTIDKCIVDQVFETCSKEEFSIITCVEGTGKINYKDGSESINKGDSILIPTSLGDYEIIGKLEILISNPTI